MTPEMEYQIKELHEKVVKLETSVETLSKSVEDLVTAWNTAKGMTAFIKWLASLAAAGTMFYAIYHGGPK